jgi:hypothetical protein
VSLCVERASILKLISTKWNENTGDYSLYGTDEEDASFDGSKTN